MSFDWQMEEDVDWDDDSGQPEKEPQEPRRRWRWGVLLVLFLSATAVFIAVRVVMQRVESATETVEDDLLASVTVIQDAAQDADSRLFSAFLSGRDKDWARASEQLIADELYLQRPAFGLQWIEVEPETAVVSSTLSPDLRAAEVLLEYDYELDVGNGLTDTVTLQQTAVYRLGENRWLLAPPEPEFWGEEKSLEAGALIVTYPERDEAIVRKLAAEWAAEWAGVCALFGEACDHGFHLKVELSTDPASLIDEPDEFEEVSVLQLPTPSLVGLPADRDGHGALYRGYLMQILRPFWENFITKQCCGGELLYDAAVKQLWQQISGWPSRDTAVDWQALQQNQITLRQANLLWSIVEPTDQNRQLANAIVKLLFDKLGISPLHVMQLMAESQEHTLLDHLIANFNSDWSAELWEREWQQFIQEQAGIVISREALPEQELLMLCRPDWGNRVALYRHDLQQNTTTLVQDFNYRYSDGFMMALPDDSGIAMSGRRSDDTVDSFLLRENVRYDLLPDRDTSIRPLAINNSGDYILWYQFGQQQTDEMVYAILDLEACLQTNDCQVHMDDLYPVWSPDGERLIGTRSSSPFLTGLNVGGLLTLRSGDGENFLQSLGFGASPVWLDEHRYGFVQTLEDARSQFFASDINSETEPELLLSVEDFAQVLPEIDELLFVDFAFRDPHDSNRIFLMMGLGRFDQYDRVLLAYDLETGALEMRWTLAEQSLHPGVYQLSPDGEWLLTSSNLPGDPPMADIHMHHLQTGTTITITMGPVSRWPNLLYADWSADSDWLAFPQNGMIALFSPDLGDSHTVIADDLYCTNAVWTYE